MISICSHAWVSTRFVQRLQFSEACSFAPHNTAERSKINIISRVTGVRSHGQHRGTAGSGEWIRRGNLPATTWFVYRFFLWFWSLWFPIENYSWSYHYTRWTVFQHWMSCSFFISLKRCSKAETKYFHVMCLMAIQQQRKIKDHIFSISGATDMLGEEDLEAELEKLQGVSDYWSLIFNFWSLPYYWSMTNVFSPFRGGVSCKLHSNSIWTVETWALYSSKKTRTVLESKADCTWYEFLFSFPMSSCVVLVLGKISRNKKKRNSASCQPVFSRKKVTLYRSFSFQDLLPSLPSVPAAAAAVELPDVPSAPVTRSHKAKVGGLWSLIARITILNPVTLLVIFDLVFILGNLFFS